MRKNNLVISVSIIAAITALCIISGCEQLLPGSFTITYDGNNSTSGMAPTDSADYTEGSEVTIMENTGNLVRRPATGTGEAFKEFDCWNTQADGSGTDYTAFSTFIMGSSDVILYAKWLTFELRDEGPAGGLVFYDKGTFSDGWRYLEAAENDQSLSAEWIEGGDTINTPNGNTDYDIGTGKANSEAIIAQEGHTGSAAQICLDYDNGTYSDWFLPSQHEMKEMFRNLADHGVGDIIKNNEYWTSTENLDTNNYVNYVKNSYSGYNCYKKTDNESCRIRAARYF